MDALLAVFGAVIPAFILIAGGALADRFLPNLDLQTLTRLSLYLFIPALVFNALAGTDLSLAGASRLALAYLGYLLVLGLVTLVGVRDLTPVERGGVIVTTLFGNTGNMGLPITLFAYGQAGLERAVVLLVVSLLLMFMLGPLLLAGGHLEPGRQQRMGLRTRLRGALSLPPLWATLIGVAMNIVAFPLPLGVARAISLLGQAAIPVMLLSLGLQMRRSWVWSVSDAALRASVFRLGAGPLVAYGVARLIGLEALDLRVLVLSAAMPAAVTMFVVAVEVGGDFRGVARTVVATTIGSLLAIVVVLLVFPAVGI